MAHVVEDEEIVRKVLHSLLGSAGHEVTRFDDGAAFIESADLDSAELIITDRVIEKPIRAATLISMVELLVSTPEREVADR